VNPLGFRVDQKGVAWTELGGVNVMPGRPITRASVAIARNGIARWQSMVETIDYAHRLATKQAGALLRMNAASGRR
jgi:hypothetical protein